MSRRLLSTLMLACLCGGCPEHDPAERGPADREQAQRQAEVAAVAATADDDVDDEDLGLDDPTMGEAPAAPLDVDHMSDQDLQTACFDGRQAACDMLGH